ncbi:hypothetical protein Tco_0700921 [Tanacetum coccineum]
MVNRCCGKDKPTLALSFQRPTRKASARLKRQSSSFKMYGDFLGISIFELSFADALHQLAQFANCKKAPQMDKDKMIELKRHGKRELLGGYPKKSFPKKTGNLRQIPKTV